MKQVVPVTSRKIARREVDIEVEAKEVRHCIDLKMARKKGALRVGPTPYILTLV